MAGATQATAREHVAGTQAASLAGATYRAAYILVAGGIVIATAYAPVNTAGLALARFLGAGILSAHAIPMYLGTETFTAVGSYTAGIGWLGALATELFARAGHGFSLLATIVAAMAAFAFVELRARRTAGRALALGAVVLAAACAPGSLGIAGGITTAAFAAALAYVLDRPGPRAAAVATLIAVVWCNVAPEGVLAPAIAACIAAATTLRGGTPQERRWSRLACAGTAVALLLTPAMFSYPTYALGAMRIDRELDGVVAFHPIDVAALAYRVGFTAMIVAGLAVGLQRDRGAAIPLFVCSAVLALLNGAYIIVFGVLAAPLLASSAASAYPRVAAMGAGSLRGDLASAIAGLGLAAALASFVAAPAAPPGYALAASLASDGHSHRVLCYDVDWCDVALAAAPAVRVFADGRVAAYPSSVLDEQRDLVRMKPHWRKALDDNRVDTLILRKDRPLTTILELSPAWHVVAGNEAASVLERTVPPQ